MLKKIISVILIATFLSSTAFATQSTSKIHSIQVEFYIKNTWLKLERTHKDILQSAMDPKFPLKAGEKPIIYVSVKANLAKIKAQLKQQMSTADYHKIAIKVLPKNFADIKQQGLLYLPYSYIVPGGRFNEMYGWDSYFIVLGLLQDGYVDLAKGMVDNFIYEINNYGTILNANRTYYLQRSQPPLLSAMILAVYQKTQDKTWLKSSLPALVKLYRFWTTPPHLIPSIGLSRYYAKGNGPAIEVTANKVHGQNYYDKVKNYYQTHVIRAYNVASYYNQKTKQLTPAFYRSDRSVRESGFDLSNKYGPFGAAITNYAPVSLNSLLYRMETNMAKIYKILKQPQVAAHWQVLANRRAALINTYLWDPKTGLFFDYNFKTKRRRPYVFATTFYPLWAGLASKKQAALVDKKLHLLEAKGGLLTSTNVSGEQWDAPFAWAPLQLFAVEGLARYGYCKDANRVATKFINTVNKDFSKHHFIVEKYNAQTASSTTSDEIQFGYKADQIGFGWTNGVYLVLQHFINNPCTT